MADAQLANKARTYLERLCGVRPNRRTGSPGNRKAVRFFASIIRELGLEVDTTPFPCLDYARGEARLTGSGEDVPIHVSPYSLPFSVRSPATGELRRSSSLPSTARITTARRVRWTTCADREAISNASAWH